MRAVWPKRIVKLIEQTAGQVDVVATARSLDQHFR